jgi:prophage regulatory protein
MEAKKQVEKIIRKKELIKTIGLSDPSIYRLEKAGRFPRRLQLGGNSVGWLQSEIQAWIEQKAAERS